MIKVEAEVVIEKLLDKVKELTKEIATYQAAVDLLEAERDTFMQDLHNKDLRIKELEDTE
jgi:hypothetical protein